MRRIITVLIAAAVLLTVFIPAFGALSEVYASPAGTSSSDTVVSSADAAYFDRIAVIPIDVPIPEFYQQVLNVAGMYIFSTPDGTVHKRIYGALNGVYGWYIPVGPENIVPVDSTPISTADDIVMYREAIEAYEAELYDGQPFAGILPPESGSFDLPAVFGIPTGSIFKYTIIGACGFCLLILLGYAIKKSRSRRR